MERASTTAQVMRLSFIKSDGVEPHRAYLQSPATSAPIALNIFESSDELICWLARYGVERYCGLRGVLDALASGEPSGLQSLEERQSEVVVKVLMDAQRVSSIDATEVRRTSLLLLSDMEHPVPALPVSGLSFCIAFLNRAITRWEGLESGHAFDLELTLRS